MSKRIDGIPVIYPEEPDTCELCGAFEETRPYGPDGKRICYDCGQKNVKETERMMGIVLFGDPEKVN